MAKVWIGSAWALTILVLVVVVPWGAGAYQVPTATGLTPTATAEGRPIESDGQRAVVATNSPLPVGATAPAGESAAATPTSPVQPSSGATTPPPLPAVAQPTPTATLEPTASLEPTPTTDPVETEPSPDLNDPFATETTEPAATDVGDPDDALDGDGAVTPLTADEATLRTRSFDGDNRVYFPLMLR
jgi:hypothetical protein